MSIKTGILFLFVLCVSASPPAAKRVRTSNFVPLSVSDRVMETSPDANFLRRRDPFLREALQRIEKSDRENDRYTPLLVGNTTIEIIPVPKMRSIRLGQVIARSFRSVTFRIFNASDIGVVYEHDCFPASSWSSPVHPLVSRKAYIDAAGHLAAGPRILFISPPTPFRETYKTSFNMTRDEFFLCSMAGATVRYAIVSLHIPDSWMNYNKYLVAVNRIITNPREKYSQLFHLGARLLFTLKELHSRQVLHGSITPESIMTTRQNAMDGGKDITFLFNGFTNAAWFNAITGVSDRNQVGRITNRSQDIVWFSPWELREKASHVLSSRDEVFRIVEIIARSVSTTPDERAEMFTNKTLYQYKKLGRLFDNGSLAIVEDDMTKFLISTKIDHVESLIRQETMYPKYNEIVYHLFTIAKLLQGENKWRFL